MKVKWLGHACFLLTSSNGVKLITDPYESGAYGGGIAYAPINEPAHIVSVSHDHGDHGYFQAVKGVDAAPTVVKGAGQKALKGISIVGIDSFHDPSQGSQRGPNTIFAITMDSVKIVHLGDLGHQVTDAQARSIGEVDVLLVPVGGNFTIDAAGAKEVMARLKPKVTIPMHYKTDHCKLPIETVDPFLAGQKNVQTIGGSEVEFFKQGLPKDPQVWVLKPAL